jgi:hypothetical protein
MNKTINHKRIDKDREIFVELPHRHYLEESDPESGIQIRTPEERSVLPFSAQLVPFYGLCFFAFI